MRDLLAHIEERSVTPRPDCRIWMGATDRGYGRISVDGRTERVHRVAWELEVGPIPEGLTIDHLCRVRACVNTEHMELVTAGENVRRAAAHRPRLTPFGPKRPRVRTHCQRGHEFTPENTYLAPDNTRECRTCKQERRRQWRAVRAS